ncbi:MAG TPA: FtsQ-type POTRA domain-containing protein [Capsulimonadaceae bacterium]|jgi:hypothetical protein
MAKLTRYPAKKKSPPPRSASNSRGAASPRLRKNRKRKNWAPIVRNWVIFLALLGLALWLCLDKRFNIRDVRYEGYQTVPKAEIAALAKVKHGQNLFVYTLLNYNKLSRRIEKGQPTIEEAHVRIRLPHTLVIRVLERQPYAQLRINQGPLLLLDANGIPYRAIDLRANALPVIVVPAGTPVPPFGMKMSDKLDNSIGVGLNVTNLLERGTQFVPLKLREVRVAADLYTTVSMADRPLVKLGLPNDLVKKLSTAASAINSDPNRALAAEYVDVTLPEKPAIKMKDNLPNPGIIH